jgi:hypothetical protein
MIEQRLMTARILWGALLMAVGLYAVVLVMAPQTPPSPPNPILPPIFGFIGLSTAVMSFIIPSIAVKQGMQRLKLPLTEAADPNAPEAFGKMRKAFRDPDKALSSAFGVWQTGLILSCALSESVALFGFVLGFLGHGWAIAAPFFAAGAILIAVRFPTAAAVRSQLASAYGVTI